GRGQERAAGAPGAVDGGVREGLDVLAVVGFRVAHVVDEPAPPAPDTHDLVSVAQRANRDRADGGVQTGNVAAAGQNRDRAFSHGRNVLVCGPDRKWPRVRPEAIVRAPTPEERV